MTTHRTARPLAAVVESLTEAGPAATVIMSDLDGCLISGSTVLPGAHLLVDRYGDRVWIVTNNSEDTGGSLSRKLGHLGLAVPPERIVTAGETMVRQLADAYPGGRLAWFGTRRLGELAEEFGLAVTTRDPQVAAVTRDPDLNGHDLAVMARLGSLGVPFWVANPDPFHPASDGTPVPETGAWWAALTAIVDIVAQRVVGKPNPDLLTRVLALAGTDPDQAVMLGDTEATDGRAADAAGVPFHLVERSFHS